MKSLIAIWLTFAPVQNPDGSYPALLASMMSGQVTEINPENIIQWRDPKRETIAGKEYWTIEVVYNAKTDLGFFECEARAYVRFHIVEKWCYVGSGEGVP